MRQAIQTRFLGPTNSRGARVRATCEAGSVTVAWDHALHIGENHVAAAKALAAKLEWDGNWQGGSISDGYCFVMIEDGASFVVPRA